MRKQFRCFIIEECQVLCMCTDILASLTTIKTNTPRILPARSLTGSQKPPDYSALSSYYKLDGAKQRDKNYVVINFV